MMLRARNKSVQACLVLEKQSTSEDHRPDGPLVLFASNLFERIIGVDSSDIQAMVFLSFISTEDVSKVAMFLDKVAKTIDVLIDQFGLYMDFDNGVSRVVSIEAMSAGSDEAAMLLCRIDSPQSDGDSENGENISGVHKPSPPYQLSPTMEFASPQVILSVHDKTPDMRVLYVSSNIRNILQYEPEDILGQPAFTYIANGNGKNYKSTIGLNTRHDMIVANIDVLARNGKLIHLRVIHFNCDNMAFNVTVTVPETVSKLKDKRGLNLERMGWHNTDTDDVGCKKPGGMSGQHGFHVSLGRQKKPQTTNTSVQACLVLEKQRTSEDHRPDGPLVLFASNSFEHIIGIDSTDIQGVAFLSLVSTEDLAKAAMFLDRVAKLADTAIERFRLRVDSNVDASCSVSVEVMAAGSDEGAMLLFQMDRPRDIADKEELDMASGYMSLEDIISSDYDTTDVDESWNDMVS
ncbi:hypothetical protein LPJ66_002367 [Kickxella alabastrina]|uniref:Uncharacterized protein n=1 Tax=Kickxella alabastrina TaxID=61397 RepID=A0ACC1IQM1_9FUNG|nr:hypothetical protein LPJ66_002367 [Kickxella alabastrina]